VGERRKIAAILVSDVVGYSRLAGADEDRILARLRALRSDLIDPTIAVHHGRIVKRTGDGAIVEFRSLVDAVNCAIEIQRAMVERNAGVAPDKRIEFRIGIHLGDVVEESDGDLMGDGVNIAARLQGVAKPGGICISDDAYRQVKGRLDLAVSDLGPTQLKNIADPVRVYSLEVGKPAQVRKTKPASPERHSMFALLAAGIVALIVITAGIWLAVRPARGPEASATTPRLSIVVLPFANLSGDPAQDYLADVLTEGLTTGLSRISGTFVIARSTAFAYKGKPVDVKQIGKDLVVRYVLEGSEQHSGNQVRVNAQLIDAETGAHLWADQFDANRADLLQMQDEIITRLARALEIQLSAVDAARVEQTRPGNLDAEDLARRCKAGDWNAAPLSKEWEAAYALCARALQIDDRNVTALGRMAWWHILPVLEAQSPDPQAAIRQADELASRALAIDPNDYWAHFSKAGVLMAQNRHEEAIVQAERSLALNPSFMEAYEILCMANSFLGRPDRAMEYADTAIRLGPRDPYIFGNYHAKGWAFFMKEQDDHAIEWLRRSAAAAPGAEPFTYLLLASAYAWTGQQAEAQDELKRYLSLSRTKTTTIAELRKQQLSIADNPAWVAYNERLFEGLRKAGMPEE
jgi:TolB-like protein/class 3 adenylate cyclase/Tfp pilus assembly protein PilF